MAKQMIYRWWPSKTDTLIEGAAQQLAIPETEFVIDDTRRYLRRLASFLTREPAGKGPARAHR